MFPSQNFLLLFGHIHLLESDGKLEFYRCHYLAVEEYTLHVISCEDLVLSRK